jgi:hypothetical protein
VASRRRIVVVLVWTLPSVVFVAVTLLVFRAYRIAPPPRLDANDRACVIAALRAAVDHREQRCDLATPANGVGVTVWSEGRPIARVDGEGDTVGAATNAAAHVLETVSQIRTLTADALARARIEADVVHGRAPLGDGYWLFRVLAVPGTEDMLAVDSGLDGIGAEVGNLHVMLLPHELIEAKLLATKRPSDDMPDFAMGVDLKRIANSLATRAGSHEPVPLDHMWRFRTDAFVEDVHGGPPLQLYRGTTPAPRLTAQALRDAALAGAHYLVDHLAANGRYIYEHDLSTGRKTDAMHVSGEYSMPRHGGTTYFLAETYRITKQEWLREPIERAFAHLAQLLGDNPCGGTSPDGGEFACVMDKTERTAQLGSTALVVVALVEYQRATGDARYLPLATKLAAFILFMQRPDGSFRHLYNSKTHQPDEHNQQLYYSGEASLALARMYVITQDRKYADAAERGIDWLVGWYDFFLGGFFYGEEHWTCIAAEAIWPTVQKQTYDDFCRGYGAFLREQQAAPGDLPDEDDFAGSYNLTPFLVPYNTPAGSRTEAMVSAYLLGKHHGDADPQIRAQIAAALQYALGQQLRADDDFAAIGSADGGMPASPVERTVRIDYVQHVCSAMIRASEWIDVAE